MGSRRRNGSKGILIKLQATNKQSKRNKLTRVRVEKLIAQGADPTKFVDHANYHVRKLAWVKMGKPLPENAEERTKFLASIHVKDEPLVEAMKDDVSDTPVEQVA